MRMHMLIKGKVQGVGYRFFTVQAANKMGLKGWVQNLPDGDVEAEVQGTEELISSFVNHLKKGHAWARVDSMQTEPLPEKSGESDFEIRG
ncbi:MAG: hypothetical protein A2901_01685 [Elusimicrobia bacterium RIFCSPLOWO2_01_FULL_54_10]|nr:MAG: hypothetical protein A2901_01685 [Elusimicrobia bacterium RIFCSPLOWO2_01_FULL_54_10]